MSGCFSNRNNNYTSNDYIVSKRNNNLFCDLNNNNSKISNVKNGVLQTTVNHAQLLNLTHGFFDYYHNVDISNSLLSQEYDPQHMKCCTCDKNYYSNNNADLSNNYQAGFITSFDTGKQDLVDNGVAFQTDYAELKKVTNFTVIDQHKKVRTKCFKLHHNISKK